MKRWRSALKNLWQIISFFMAAGVPALVFPQSWYDTQWSERQSISIDSDHTDFGLSGNLNNYPVLIQLTDGSNDLFDRAQPDGDDILFTAFDGTTKLPHEIEEYSETAGTEVLRAWVQVPVFNSSANTTVYLYYGNPSAGSQENPTGVWDGNFSGVWHLDEEAAGTGTLDLYRDATTNANHGDDLVSAAGKAGKIGQGQQFDGTDDYIDCGNDGSFNADYVTVELWINVSGWVNDGGILAKGDNAYRQYWMWTYDSAVAVEVDEGGHHNYAWNPLAGQWVHLALTYDGSSVTTYRNGTLENSYAQATGAIDATAQPLLFGSIPGFNFLSGFLDEVRVSSAATPAGVRSPDWIRADYVSQNDPASYLTFQTEVPETQPQGDQVIIRNNIINPSRNEYATISITLGSSSKVTITIYDLAGDPVKVLYSQTAGSGTTDVQWDGKNRRGSAVVQGLYYAVIKLGKNRYVHKILVVR